MRELVDAHVELARAEVEEIAGEATRMAGLGALGLALAFAAALLVFIGLFLFLGEWLFGSIGWGMLLGTLLLVAMAILAVASAIRVSGRDLGIATGLAFLVGVVVGFVMAGDLLNRAWTLLAGNVVPTLDPAWRPLLVAVVAVGVAGLAIGLLVALVKRVGGWAFLWVILAAGLAGVLIGALTAIAPGIQVGIAIAITAGLIAWIALLARTTAQTAQAAAESGSFKARFTPARTIETTKETIEWLRARMPLSRGS